MGRRVRGLTSVGREGMVGISAMADGGVAPSVAMVQAEMEVCYRMTAKAFRRHMDRRGVFSELLTPVGHDEFPLTQEFVAMMLGASRPTVTVVAGTLQKAGLIKYQRGRVTIVDGAALEEASCECYPHHHRRAAARHGHSVVTRSESTSVA